MSSESRFSKSSFYIACFWEMNKLFCAFDKKTIFGRFVSFWKGLLSRYFYFISIFFAIHLISSRKESAHRCFSRLTSDQLFSNSINLQNYSKQISSHHYLHFYFLKKLLKKSTQNLAFIHGAICCRCKACEDSCIGGIGTNDAIFC